MIYEGQTIANITNVQSWKKCDSECKKYLGCKYWSWFAGNYGDCLLKTSDIGRKRTSVSVVSGRNESREGTYCLLKSVLQLYSTPTFIVESLGQVKLNSFLLSDVRARISSIVFRKKYQNFVSKHRKKKTNLSSVFRIKLLFHIVITLKKIDFVVMIK